LDWDVVADLRARVASRLESERSDPRWAGLGRSGLSEADQRALAASLVLGEIEKWAQIRARAGLRVAEPDTERALAAAVLAALFGMSRLQPLLEREDVENVHVHGVDRVVLELAGGRLEAAAPVAGADAELLHKPCLISDQHPTRVTEPIHHIPADTIADPVNVPVRPPQQPLHPIR
jgi:hypothetical protein